MNIGIIGTAGRKEDAPLINPTLYSQMVDVVLKLVVLQDKVLSNHPDPITLVSGGAAVADHIAVQLALAEPKYKLKLHLPASFVIAQKQYD